MIFLNLKKLVVRSWNVLNWNYSFSFFLNSTSLFICLEGGLLLGDPIFYALAGALLEGYAEGAVAAVTTAVGQLLGLDRLALGGGRRLAEELYEIIDAQRVDVGIVGSALAREIHAEIGAVGAQGLSQLHRRKVGLQVEFVALAAVVQQLTNLLDNGL